MQADSPHSAPPPSTVFMLPRFHHLTSKGSRRRRLREMLFARNNLQPQRPQSILIVVQQPSRKFILSILHSQQQLLKALLAVLFVNTVLLLACYRLDRWVLCHFPHRKQFRRIRS